MDESLNRATEEAHRREGAKACPPTCGISHLQNGQKGIAVRVVGGIIMSIVVNWVMSHREREISKEPGGHRRISLEGFWNGRPSYYIESLVFQRYWKLHWIRRFQVETGFEVALVHEDLCQMHCSYWIGSECSSVCKGEINAWSRMKSNKTKLFAIFQLEAWVQQNDRAYSEWLSMAEIVVGCTQC